MILYSINTLFTVGKFLVVHVFIAYLHDLRGLEMFKH